jgi:hypothetical protein
LSISRTSPDGDRRRNYLNIVLGSALALLPGYASCYARSDKTAPLPAWEPRRLPKGQLDGAPNAANQTMKTLLFKLSDFADEEITEGEGDDRECSCGAPDVEPLPRLTQERCNRGNLFRVLEPVSLTPFGPLGPGLTLGQIIEAEPVSTGVWRYVRTHFRLAVRSWRVSCEQPDVLNRPDISPDLQLLRELNCGWEWSVGNITIQRVSMEGDPLLSEVERIVHRLSQKLQRR